MSGEAKENLIALGTLVEYVRKQVNDIYLHHWTMLSVTVTM